MLTLFKCNPFFHSSNSYLEKKVKVFVMFFGYFKLLNGYLVLSAKLKRIFRKSANIENIPKPYFSSHRPGIVDMK